MLNVRIDEIQGVSLKYTRLAETGVRLVITQASKPIAELKPISMLSKQLRPFFGRRIQFNNINKFSVIIPAI